MPTPRRGEIWLLDFGLAGKTRPALIISTDFGDQDRALVTVVPHTTSLRGSQFEIPVHVSFLKPGAFMVQGVTTSPTVNALYRLGVLPTQSFTKSLLEWRTGLAFLIRSNKGLGGVDATHSSS